MFSTIPNNEDTKRYSNYEYWVDKMEVVNIKPKEIEVLKKSVI
ncbi:hypothetical protein [Clostridium sp.]